MDYKPPVKSSVNKIRTSRQSRTSTSHKSAYAGALATPAPRPESFEKRMRDLLRPKKKPTVAPSAARPSNLVTVETLLDFKKVVADEEHRIVAVRFYSPYCRACKAMAPLFYHLATQHQNTLFVDVPVTHENANLHQGLGVPSIPYGHLYQPGKGLVEEMRLVKKLMPEFEDKLSEYIQRQEVAESS